MGSYCKNTSIHNIYILLFMITLKDKHNREMLPLVSLTVTSAIRFTKELDKTNGFVKFQKNNAQLKKCSV